MPNRLIVQESAGRVQVSLQRHTRGVAEPPADSQPFAFPLAAEEREDLRWYLEDYLTKPYAVWEERGKGIARRLDAWGERLFEELFGPGRTGRGVYQRARRSERPGTGGDGPLELWLASSSPEFLSLPWELLKDPARPVPLALDGVVSRTVSGMAAAAQGQAGRQLRVLMVISRPDGTRDVRYRMIARPLLERLGPVSGEVRLEVLRPPTLEALHQELERARAAGEPYQILHFDGHGAFGAGPGAPDAHGYLVFEAVSGGADLVPVADLAEVLGVDLLPPLLVFNACRSAMLQGGARPEAAVATALLARGAAAVVAMSYTVYARAVAEFMAAFYEALFAGHSVSQAVGAGRRQLHRANRRPSPKGPLPLADWIVPVHYARREIAFPELQRRASRPEGVTLERALADLQETPTEGVHQEGSLEPEGQIFFGRDAEIYELERALRTRRVALVHGMGGTGKTELAKGVARWLQASGGLDDPQLVFFHSFEPGVASFGLDGVVTSVGLRLFGADFARRPADVRLQAVLGELRRRRMLLIWDNFETVHSLPDSTGTTPPLDETQRRAVRELLARVTGEARGGVLITSRSPEPWLGEGVHRVELGGLAAEDALDYAETLLASRPLARQRRRDRAFGRLLELIAGHPLSLRLLLPLLEQVKDARELVEALEGLRALPVGFDEGEGRLGSLGACVHYSFQHLRESHRRRLPALALFQGVADATVLATLSHDNGAPARFRDFDRGAWGSMLSACASVGLLTKLTEVVYRIHPALPHYLRALWREEAGAAFDEEQAAARVASIKAHARLANDLTWAMKGSQADIAMSVVQTERRTLAAVATEAFQRGLFGDARRVLQPLMALWNSQGLYREARCWLERWRALLEEGKERPPALDTDAGELWLFVVGSLAQRLTTEGDLDRAEAALTSIARTLEESGSCTPPDAPATVRTESGGTQKRAGTAARSMTHGEWARGQLGGAYHGLGMVAVDRGNLGAAEVWFRKAVAILEVLGDARVAASYHQLGALAHERGDLDPAETWYLRSLKIKQTLGDGRGMAASYQNLGAVAQDRGDLDAAQNWYLQTLQIRAALNDQDGMAHSYQNLGSVAKRRGYLDAAETWATRSLEIREALGDRRGLALSYGQMGDLAEARGRSAEALDWALRAMNLFPEFPHQTTKPAARQLARLTAKLGMPALEASWHRLTGQPLPDAVRALVLAHSR